jgi:hypothetical protein
MRFGLIIIGTIVIGIPLYVATSTLLGVVGKEPWMSICLFASLAAAGILCFWATRRLAATHKALLDMMSGGVRKTFGVVALVMGVIILGWFVYNRFSPTPEFKSSYVGLFQLSLPLAMIGVGCMWLMRKPEQVSSRYPHFVFARIEDPIGPLERGVKYDHPLDDALAERDMGEVSGGGEETTKDGHISWIGLDIDLANLTDALEFTRQRLRELGAPPGSVLEYQDGDKKVVLPIHEK